MNNFNFCLFYESQIILGAVYDKYVNYKDPDPQYPQPVDFFKYAFINDATYAAKNYFDHPSYLRINGRPVFFIHNLPNLYRNLSDLVVQELFNNTRSRLLEEYKEDIYFIGDFGSESDVQKVNVNWTYSMDAITHYFFSDPSKGWNTVLNDAKKCYPEWSAFAKSNKIKFIPNVYPGFNNTGCEGVTAPTVLPTNGTALKEMLNMAKRHIDTDLKIVMITSWNEWKESTAIEPSTEHGELLLHIIYDNIKTK